MIALRAWSQSDLPILQQTVGDPSMMLHLGGAESAAAIERRHRRYLETDFPEKGAMYVILLCEARVAAGTIGYWRRPWNGEDVYETGWMVLPKFAGRGIATRAAQLIIAKARRLRAHRYMHAFPSIENQPSNKVCERAGFINLGECAFEYPKGTMMRCNDWQIELFR